MNILTRGLEGAQFSSYPPSSQPKQSQNPDIAGAGHSGDFSPCGGDLTPHYQIGLNHRIVGKDKPHRLSYPGAWENSRLTMGQLAQHIALGHPWMPASLNGDRNRRQCNANGAEVLGLDIDSGLTIEQALEHPYIRQHCGLLIESSSSTPELNKFRLVFPLSEPIHGWQNIRLANRWLAKQVGSADPACKDASRFFYGGLGRQPHLLEEFATLPPDFLNQAQSWDAEQQAVRAAEAEARRRRAAMPRDESGDLVRDALQYIAPYTPGGKRYDDLLRMMAGVLNDLGSEGERLLLEWDAGRGKWGEPLERKLAGLARRDGSATLGSLFDLAKREGFVFPKRQWLAGQGVVSIAPAPVDRLRQWLDGHLTRSADTTALPLTLSPESVPPEGIVGLAAGQALGKSTLIAAVLRHNGAQKRLSLNHRIALGRNIAQRLDLAYRADCDVVQGRYSTQDGYAERLCACVDAIAHPSFSPEHWAGCDLVLDELTQLLRHLLTSGTLKDRRACIIQRFEALVKGAGRVFVADADLDDKSLGYIESLRGERCWLLRHEGKTQPWQGLTYIHAPDRSPIFAAIELDASRGKRLFVVSDSIRCCEDLEARLRPVVGALNLLTITSKTSGGEAEQAFITNPSAPHGYQVVIVSPSAITGLSDESGWFEQVYGIFQGGSIVDGDVMQALMRVRHNVHRTIWARERGSAVSKLGDSTDQRVLASRLQQQATTTAAIMSGQLGLTVDTGSTQTPAAELFCQFEADRNFSMQYFGPLIRGRLEQAGHELVSQSHESNKLLMAEMAEARADREQRDAVAIANAEPIDQAEADRLKRKESLSVTERHQLQRFILEQFYKTEVTAQLVLDDDGGNRRQQVRRIEGLLYPETAQKRDRAAVEGQQQLGAGITWWDVPHAALKSRLRRRLGLERWLDCDREWSGDSPELITLHKVATTKAAIEEIKTALGVSLRPSMKPVTVLGMLLAQLGLETHFERRTKQGKKVRFYRLEQASFEAAFDVVEKRRESIAPKEKKQGHTPPSISVAEGGGVAPENSPPCSAFWAVCIPRNCVTRCPHPLVIHAEQDEYRCYRTPDGQITP